MHIHSWCDTRHTTWGEYSGLAGGVFTSKNLAKSLLRGSHHQTRGMFLDREKNKRPVNPSIFIGPVCNTSAQLSAPCLCCCCFIMSAGSPEFSGSDFNNHAKPNENEVWLHNLHPMSPHPRCPTGRHRMSSTATLALSIAKSLFDSAKVSWAIYSHVQITVNGQRTIRN